MQGVPDTATRCSSRRAAPCSPAGGARGNQGQLGHGDQNNQLSPKLVAGLEGRRIVQVAAGDYHSLFLTKGGPAPSRGSGEDGALGHGDTEDQLAPKLVAGLAGRRVVQVAGGATHSLFLTKGGAVLSCGSGGSGGLGHGDPKDQPVPKLLCEF